MENSNYFVQLRLTIGIFEKHTEAVVSASSAKLARKQALENECHGDADYTRFANYEGCEDTDADFMYVVVKCKAISMNDAEIYRQITL